MAVTKQPDERGATSCVTLCFAHLKHAVMKTFHSPDGCGWTVLLCFCSCRSSGIAAKGYLCPMRDHGQEQQFCCQVKCCSCQLYLLMIGTTAITTGTQVLAQLKKYPRDYPGVGGLESDILCRLLKENPVLKHISTSCLPRLTGSIALKRYDAGEVFVRRLLARHRLLKAGKFGHILRFETPAVSCWFTEA